MVKWCRPGGEREVRRRPEVGGSAEQVEGEAVVIRGWGGGESVVVVDDRVRKGGVMRRCRRGAVV